MCSREHAQSAAQAARQETISSHLKTRRNVEFFGIFIWNCILTPAQRTKIKETQTSCCACMRAPWINGHALSCRSTCAWLVYKLTCIRFERAQILTRVDVRFSDLLWIEHELGRQWVLFSNPTCILGRFSFVHLRSSAKWNARVLRTGSDENRPCSRIKATQSVSRSSRPKRGKLESCSGKNVRARLEPFHLNWSEPVLFGQPDQTNQNRP